MTIDYCLTFYSYHYLVYVFNPIGEVWYLFFLYCASVLEVEIAAMHAKIYMYP